MKKLVTHPRPHLDDICGIWLIKQYMPGWESAEVDFMSAINAGKDSDDTLYVGIGRGQFDEHKGDVGESATSLVWKHLRTTRTDLPEHTLLALDRLVEWVRKVDTSTHDPVVTTEHGPWLPAEQLRVYYNRHNKDSGELQRWGEEICALALGVYENDVRLEADWKNRVDFDTPWGKGAAVETDVHGVDDYAYSLGYVLLIYQHPRNGFRGYRAAPPSAVDLTATSQHLSEIEPKASWFLHHTKKLLLSGSDVAPEMTLSQLSLQELVDAIR